MNHSGGQSLHVYDTDTWYLWYQLRKSVVFYLCLSFHQ